MIDTCFVELFLRVGDRIFYYFFKGERVFDIFEFLIIVLVFFSGGYSSI